MPVTLPSGFTIDTQLSPDRVRVQWPATATPGTSTLPNLDFESGDVNWIKGNGWEISTGGLVETGSWSAKYSGTGQSSVFHEQAVPVTPGTTITATARVSKGNTRKDFAGGGISMLWLDESLAVVGIANGGTLVNSGGPEFQTASITGTAPAGAAYVRLFFDATRDVKGRASDKVYVDNIAWNHSFAVGGTGGGSTAPTGPITLTFRVRDSNGCEAVATRTIGFSSVNSIALSIWNKMVDWYSNETNGATITGRKAGIAQTYRTQGAGPHSVTNLASPVGNAIQLSGTAVNNCNGYSSAANIGTSYTYNDEVSIWAIVRVTAAPSYLSHFSIFRTDRLAGASPTQSALIAAAVNTSGQLQASQGIDSNSALQTITSTQPPVNTWASYYLANIMDGAIRRLESSINGEGIAIGTGSYTASAVSGTGQITLSGGMISNQTMFREGTPPQVQLSEQAFFNGRLTQAEVDYLHNGGTFRTFDQLKADAGIL